MTLPGRRQLAKLGIAVLLAALLSACADKKPQARGPVAVPVTVAQAVQKDVPLQISAIGAVESPTAVQIKSMVNGEITSVRFKEGQEVKKGELLFTIDRRPMEATLRLAEATLAKDRATAMNARADAARYEALWKQGVVAQQQAEQMQTAAAAATELVKADEAAVANAKVQLTYTDIYAPISGRTGNLQIQLGNVVKANDTPYLVAINQMNPIYVTFTIPEQQLGLVKRYMAEHKLTVSATVPNDPRPAVGTLTFVDNAVDRQTGTIKLKGTFDNNDRRLWPGQFVNVSLTLATQPNAVLVPSVAVQSGQQGPFIFVVKDGKAESRQVKIDRTIGDQSVVASGVAPGDVVVTDGQLRLTPGAAVDIRGQGGPQSQNADVAKPQDSRS